MQPDEMEISIDDLAGMIKKRWKLILIPGFIAAVVVGGVSSTLPKTYESSALLRVGYSGSRPLESIAATREIMKSRAVLQEIAERTTGQNKPEIALSLANSITYDTMGEILKITAKSKDPEEAVKITGTAAEIIVERHNVLYENARKKLDETTRYLGEKVKPALIAESLNELKIEPTRIEFPAGDVGHPLKSKAKLLSALAFLGVVMFTTLVAFYLEGKER